MVRPRGCGGVGGGAAIFSSVHVGVLETPVRRGSPSFSFSSYHESWFSPVHVERRRFCSGLFWFIVDRRK
jgi:hypothetical protein